MPFAAASSKTSGLGGSSVKVYTGWDPLPLEVLVEAEPFPFLEKELSPFWFASSAWHTQWTCLARCSLAGGGRAWCGKGPGPMEALLDTDAGNLKAMVFLQETRTTLAWLERGCDCFESHSRASSLSNLLGFYQKLHCTTERVFNIMGLPVLSRGSLCTLTSQERWSSTKSHKSRRKHVSPSSYRILSLSNTVDNTSQA